MPAEGTWRRSEFWLVGNSEVGTNGVRRAKGSVRRLLRLSSLDARCNHRTDCCLLNGVIACNDAHVTGATTVLLLAREGLSGL